MSRNPMAGSLRNYRQRIVQDKRESKLLEALAEMRAYDLNMIGLPDPDGISQV